MQPRIPGTPEAAFGQPETPVLAHLAPAQHAPSTPVYGASYEPPTKRNLPGHEEKSAKKFKEESAVNEPERATYVVVCKDADDVATKTIVGEYIEKGDNHGRKVFQKKAASGAGTTHVNVLLYYWDEQDGSKYTGWWLGHRLGGTQVWAQNPAKDKLPPRSGWQVPWDGPVRASVQVMSKTEKLASEREEELHALIEQVATVKADAMYTWSQVVHPRAQSKLTVGRYSEIESSLAAHLINAEAMCGKLKSLEESTKQMQSPVVLPLFKKVRGAALGLQNGLKTELEKVRDKRRALELIMLEKEAEHRDKGLVDSFVEECRRQLTGLARSVETAIQAVRDAQKASVVQARRAKEEAAAAEKAEADKAQREKEEAQQLEASKSHEDKAEASAAEAKETSARGEEEEEQTKNEDGGPRQEKAAEEVPLETHADTGHAADVPRAEDGQATTATAGDTTVEMPAVGHSQVAIKQEDEARLAQPDQKSESDRQDLMAIDETKDGNTAKEEPDAASIQQKRKQEEVSDEQGARLVKRKTDEAAKEGTAKEETMQVKKEEPEAEPVDAVDGDAGPATTKLGIDVSMDDVPMDVDMCKLHAEESVSASLTLLTSLKDTLSKHLQTCANFQEGARSEAQRAFATLQLQVDAQSVLLAPYNDVRLEWEQQRVTKETAAKLFNQSNDLEALRAQAMEALDRVEKSTMPESEAAAAMAAVESVQEAHKALQLAVQNCDPQTRQSLSVHIPSMLVAASGTVRQLQGRWKELQQMAKASESLNSVRSEVAVHSAALAAFETDIKTMQDAIRSGECDWVTDELNKVEAELHSLVGSITNTRVHTQVKALEVRRFSSDACKTSLAQFQELQQKLSQTFGPQANTLKDEIKKLRGALLVHEVDVKVGQVEECATKAAALPAILGSASKVLEAPLEAIQAAFTEWQSLSQALEQAKSTRLWAQAKQVEVKHQKSGWEWSSDIAKRMARLSTAQSSLERSMHACSGAEAHLSHKQSLEEWTAKCASTEDRVSKMQEVFSRLPAKPQYPASLHDLGDDLELKADIAAPQLMKEAEQAQGQAQFHEKLVGKTLESVDWQALGPGFAEHGVGIQRRLEVVRKQVSESAVVLQEYKEALKAWPLVQEALKDFRDCRAKVKAVEECAAASAEAATPQIVTPAAATASLRRVKSLLHVKEITLKSQCQLAPTAIALVATLQGEVESMLQKMQKATSSKMPKVPVTGAA